MSNTNNPFGDEKLLDTFVWTKKLEKKGLTDVAPEHLKVMTAKRVEENKVKFQIFIFFEKDKMFVFFLNI